jgi:hypothetical protein
LTFRPTPNASGTAQVQVVARDNGGTANGGSDTSSAATFTITVTPVNDAPIAVNDTATVRRNGSVTIRVLANDLDSDGGTLSITSAQVVGKGKVTNKGVELVYQPARNFTGSERINYTISDGQGGTASASVTVTVTK